jgi:hypothetical protein
MHNVLSANLDALSLGHQISSTFQQLGEEPFARCSLLTYYAKHVPPLYHFIQR